MCNFAAKITKKTMFLKRILQILLLCGLAVSALAQSPKHEVRAVWLTTIGGIDWPQTYATSPASAARQRQELCHTLDQLRQANINVVLIQARVRATTIYPSALEPWDACLAGKPGQSPGYDPLQYAIDECHKRGMQCHAWMVTIPVGKWNDTGCRQLRKAHPGLIVKIGDEGYMNPEKAETGDYLARLCADITRRYDVDGIHLDYIRYPETWKLKVSRQQGRQHITAIVSKISRAVKAQKPWVMMSCSPIGKYDDLARFNSMGWNANSAVCQDAQGWLRDGLMDALFPMMYFQGNHFYPFLVNWQEHAYGKIVVPGLAAYMLHPRERNWPLSVIAREMEVARREGMGHTFFRSKFLTDNVKGIYTFTRQFDRLPALLPPMRWLRTTPPQAPRQLTLQRGQTADLLTWAPEGDDRQSNDRQNDTSQGDYLLYNIYASPTSPVDTSDPANLIAARQREPRLVVPHNGQPLNYAVTAADRYGLESQPARTAATAHKAGKKMDIRQLIVGKKHKRDK